MKALAAVVLLLGLAACSSSGDDEAADRAPETTGTSSPSTTPPDQAPDQPPGARYDLADTEVCGLVRDGIDQFNLGDLDATVEKFAAAVPEAEKLAEDQPGAGTEGLLAAVRYYAELPARDYPTASQTSPEFLKYKDFTLTECAYGAPPADADPGIPA